MDVVSQDNGELRELLRAVAEQLKLPLLHIARQAELSRMNGPRVAELQTIGRSADMALGMVDAYLLGLQLAAEQTELALEPVSLSSVLNDTAHALSTTAQAYRVDVELGIAGKYEPVMANGPALKAALSSLGYSLIVAQTEPNKKQRPVMQLAAWRATGGGLVAGIYGDSLPVVSAEALARARRLYGRVRQPLTGLSGSAAGIFVADTILAAMTTSLRASRHHKQPGLAATFQPSRQLQLV